MAKGEAFGAYTEVHASRYAGGSGEIRIAARLACARWNGDRDAEKNGQAVRGGVLLSALRKPQPWWWIWFPAVRVGAEVKQKADCCDGLMRRAQSQGLEDHPVPREDWVHQHHAVICYGERDSEREGVECLCGGRGEAVSKLSVQKLCLGVYFDLDCLLAAVLERVECVEVFRNSPIPLTLKCHLIYGFRHEIARATPLLGPICTRCKWNQTFAGAY